MIRFPPRIAWRVLAFFCALVLVSATAAEAAARKNHRNKSSDEVSAYIPKDLEDCFAELDKLWPAEKRQEFRNKPEEKLIEYHFELGMWMRNRWRLWAGSRLQNYFAALGVPHPESISMIIITSYWRRENHREIRLEEQITRDRAEWEQQRRQQEEEEIRVAQALEKAGKSMLGLEYPASSPPSIAIRQRSDDGIRARSLARFRGGVLLTIRQPVPNVGPKDTYALVPYFLDLTEERIHPIRLPEITDISYSVVAGDWLWVVGKGDGELRLLALSQAACTPVALPRSDEIPQLGLSGDQLLLVYSNSIYRREHQGWRQLYSGDLKPPLSGPPPRQYGDKIYFRDEGREENEKQLWFLELSAVPRLVPVWDDTGLVGPSGPRWENTFGYCVLDDGTLWATFGEGGTQSKSLLRRGPTGEYRIAVFNNSVNLHGDLLGRSDNTGPDLVTTSGSGWKQSRSQDSNPKGADLSISGIAAKSADELVAVADTGLFTIHGNKIKKLLTFRNAQQRVPLKQGLLHWNWDPTDILFLTENSYLISGSFGGIYLLRQDQAKRWSMKSLDEQLGKPLIW
jgi:hypothetical protein